jgi:GTP-binding protein YchF
MNIGIIGLPQTGKKTLFELLVGKGAVAPHGVGHALVRGVAEVQDSRFEALVKLYAPKKTTRARVEILLPPRIEGHAVSESDIFKDLAEVEAFCHVVRSFESQSVYHAMGSIDPVRDIDYVNAEFILHDLLFVEKRIDRIERDLRKIKDERAMREKDVLAHLRTALESEKPLRVIRLADEDEKLIKSYPLLSRRAMVVVLNASDDETTDRAVPLNERYRELGLHCIQARFHIEREIAALESAAEREEFMREMGISDTALHALTSGCIDALRLISFFTVAPAEVRQWFVARGASALEAAGKIHTDLARGFIRAEVIKSADLFALGSEDKVKHAGKLGVKGRDYIVEDGDILYIRFNV